MATNVEIPEGLEELFQQTWFDHVLHYGLLVGAVFQIICIAAIVVLPSTPDESDNQAVTSGTPREGSSSEDGGDKTKTGTSGSGSKKGPKSKARKRK